MQYGIYFSSFIYCTSAKRECNKKNEKNKSHIARAVTAITGLSHGSKINESEEVKARRVVSKPVHFVKLRAHTTAKDKQNNAIASFI